MLHKGLTLETSYFQNSLQRFIYFYQLPVDNQLSVLQNVQTVGLFQIACVADACVIFGRTFGKRERGRGLSKCTPKNNTGTCYSGYFRQVLFKFSYNRRVLSQVIRNMKNLAESCYRLVNITTKLQIILCSPLSTQIVYAAVTDYEARLLC